MKTSCIRHPENARYIQLYLWQVQFCQGNHCAALVLSVFIAWHDWKLRHDRYYRRSNDISEMHGDGRPHLEDAYIFFTIEELIKSCMGLYGKKSINEALALLVSLEVISIHKNPNPRYHFDKTKYFRFYPEICNRWVAENYPVISECNDIASQVVEYSDGAKVANREGKNSFPSGENGFPSGENDRAITNTTNKTTNNNHSINARDLPSNPENNSTEPSDENSALVQPVINALRELGMPAKHFTYTDVPPVIKRLCLAGATVSDFIAAFERATQYANRGFGVKYLVPIVESLLTSKNSAPRTPAVPMNHSSSLAHDSEVVYGENIVDPLIQKLMDEEDKRINQ